MLEGMDSFLVRMENYQVWSLQHNFSLPWGVGQKSRASVVNAALDPKNSSDNAIWSLSRAVKRCSEPTTSCWPTPGTNSFPFTVRALSHLTSLPFGVTAFTLPPLGGVWAQFLRHDRSYRGPGSGFTPGKIFYYPTPSTLAAKGSS